MKKILLALTLSVFLTSCGRNSWSKNERNSYLDDCIKGYQNSNPNVSESYAKCYCVEALILSMDKYATGEEAENNATLSEMNMIATRASYMAHIHCE